VSEHTPTPWDHSSLCVEEATGEGQLFSAGDVHVFPPYGEAGPVATVSGLANAAFIVKAVNSHDVLVSHLRRLAVRCCDDAALELLHTLSPEPPPFARTAAQGKGS